MCKTYFHTCRIIHHLNAFKKVVVSLCYAFPPLLLVLVICLILWLIFAILGVAVFKGLFQECVDQDGQRFSHEIVPNRSVCLTTEGGLWVNSR